MRHQGELLGALGVTKRTGEALTPVEENLLIHLAGQAGLVLKNVGLTSALQARLEELRASRQRLVTAQDEDDAGWSATSTTAPSSTWWRSR